MGFLATAALTDEHVLGAWLTRIGQDLDAVPHGAGPLNRIGRGFRVRVGLEYSVSAATCGFKHAESWREAPFEQSLRTHERSLKLASGAWCRPTKPQLTVLTEYSSPTRFS